MNLAGEERGTLHTHYSLHSRTQHAQPLLGVREGGTVEMVGRETGQIRGGEGGRTWCPGRW